ncbi:MAG: hypothetical protein C0524_04390 [Rhodobacter sp.]|nr:hypothetical protein [Rhodobacter sp.]
MEWILGAFRLDPERFELRRGTRPVALEPQVLALLLHLIRNRDRMVTKDEIAAMVWQGRIASDASIYSRVKSLRQAVGDDGQHQSIIRTVHGRSFRFMAEVRETAAAKVPATRSGVKPTSVLTGRPSIAILPFHPLAMAPALRFWRVRSPARSFRPYRVFAGWL